MSAPAEFPERVVIRGVRVVDPDSGIDEIRDLLIDRGVLEAMEPSLPPGVDGVDLSATGKIAAPGLQDMRVHLREPGDEEAETIQSGARAAARGGVTRLLAMPDTCPVADNRGVIEQILRSAAEACGTRIVPAGALTKGREGAALAEMMELRAAGVCAVTDADRAVVSSDLMRRAMEYARGADLLVISHCEDPALRGAGVMNEGYWSTILGMRGIPTEAETTMLARDIALSRRTGCRLHIGHVSCAQAVSLIRQAKAEGLPVSAETAPHYLALTEQEMRSYDALFKVNPPLRTEADRRALKEGLRDGTIDVVASDHAPHPTERKAVEVDAAPFGAIGLETALSVCIEELIVQQVLDWPGLIHAMSSRVAGILGWGGGRMEIGAPADLLLIDPDAVWEVQPDRFSSRSRNSPFLGRTLTGRVLLTIAEGRVTHMETALLG
ncbi:MAG: amidohydrolase family protein [Candidatus Eisenbacteria bacterium]|nr:amidohydrolase family protein [Candidatus Latescibacterota bacterium]MBD3302501.1 amidohydrolase family protein [Candidatus Eisenbacteria bacterium]